MMLQAGRHEAKGFQHVKKLKLRVNHWLIYYSQSLQKVKISIRDFMRQMTMHGSV